MGLCEKHQLPLDRNGECELCRLSDMPSQAPPTRSALWAAIIPMLLLVAGVAWAMSYFGSAPADPPPRGVPKVSAPPADAATPEQESPAPEPDAIPEAPQPPVPDDILVPEPSPESGQLEDAPAPSGAPVEANLPDWKSSVARRRVQITMYATQWCEVCRKARDYMQANQIEFIELDTDENAMAGERLRELNPGRTIPTFEIDGQVYIGFNEDQFEAKIDEAARKYL